MPVKTSTQNKKGKHKKPGISTVEFLRKIPGAEEPGISLKKLAEGDESHFQVLLKLVEILSFFNTISVEEIGEDRVVRSTGTIAHNFLMSMSRYLENGYQLFTQWSVRDGLVDDNEDEGELKNGLDFLISMEEKRVKRFNDSAVLNEVHIALFIIKANVKGSPDPMFLMEYNVRTRRYQFVGGYIDGDDVRDIKKFETRFINKDFPNSEYTPKDDFKLEQVSEPLMSSIVSHSWGINTAYNIHLIKVRFSRAKIRIEDNMRWLSLDEITQGMTTDGIKVISPLTDIEDPGNFQAFLEEVPLSIAKVQPKISTTTQVISLRTQDSVRIKRLSEREETSTLEYKSSARWDYHTKQVNKDLEKSIVKTIAGFLNSEGGTLVIGMDDHKQTLGIENDIKTLSRQDEDGYRQYLTSLVTEYLGVEYISFIKISFEYYLRKTLCLVDVNVSPSPVFVRNKNDREFYVRTTNSTRQLNAEEMYKYSNIHW